MNLHYVNKKGNRVAVHISDHALNRFFHRMKWFEQDAGGVTEIESSPEKLLERLFSKAVILDTKKSKNRRYENRPSAREDDIYLRSGPVTFVVNNGEIITVEISQQNFRHLNYRPAGMACAM